MSAANHLEISIEVGATEMLLNAMFRRPVAEYVEDIKELTEEEINAKNSTGRTMLHQAVILGKTDWAKELLGAGANEMVKDGDGKTALQLAKLMLSKHAGEKERQDLLDIMLDRASVGTGSNGSSGDVGASIGTRRLILELKESLKIDITKISSQLNVIKESHEDMKVEFNAMRNSQEEMKDGLYMMKNSLEGVEAKVNSVKNSQGEMKGEVNAVKKSQEEMKDGLNLVKNSQGEMKGEVNAVKKSQEEMKDGLNLVKNSQGEMKGEVNAVKKSQEEMKDGLNLVKNSQGEMKGEVNAVKKSQEEMKDGLNLVKNSQGEMKGEVNAVKKSQGEIKIEVNGVKKSLEGVKGEVTTNGDKLKTQIQDVEIKVGNMIISLIGEAKRDNCIDGEDESDSVERREEIENEEVVRDVIRPGFHFVHNPSIHSISECRGSCRFRFSKNWRDETDVERPGRERKEWG